MSAQCKSSCRGPGVTPGRPEVKGQGRGEESAVANMTFHHSLIIALMNGCKVAAGRQEAVCVCVCVCVAESEIQGGGCREEKRGEEKGGEAGELLGSIHCS